MKQLTSILFLISFSLALPAQTIIKGKVVDSETRAPLAFANILVNKGPDGGGTDIDGKFAIKTTQTPQTLRVNYVGYESQVVEVKPTDKEIVIRLQMSAFMLDEVTVKPKANPADAIIEKVVENRNINNYERLESFKYTYYEKMKFAPEIDTLSMNDNVRMDSGFIRFNEFTSKQHLFFMESVAERSFKFPNKNYNKVIASRISGFKNQGFVFLISQLQSNSFYNEIIDISGKQYVNPISFGSTKKYYFHIEDTLVEPFPYDTTFVLSFRPFLKTNFDGLRGTISISTNGYAIRNVDAEPAKQTKGLKIKIQQLYDWAENSHWFPKQLNTEIRIPAGSYVYNPNDSVITIGANNDTIKKPQTMFTLTIETGKPDTVLSKNKHAVEIIGSGRSYIKSVEINPHLKNSQFGFVDVDVSPDAHEQPESVWSAYRHDSLTDKEKMTYQVIDSVGKEAKFDRLVQGLDLLGRGKVQIKFLDLDLLRTFPTYNRYEGFRWGLGASTNYKISEHFTLGGYFAYGFRDKAWKYGGDFTLILNRFREMELKLVAENDVNEAGADMAFSIKNKVGDQSFRQYMINRMDSYVKQQAVFGARVFKWAKADVSFTRLLKNPKYDYTYVNARNEDAALTNNKFQFSEAALTVRYAYKEKFVKTTKSLRSMGTKAPVVWATYTRGINGFWGGQYDYNRYDFKIQKTISTKYLGQTKLELSAGFIDRDIPYVNLFNARSGYYSAGITLYDPSSFVTMRINEFVADRYATIHFSHNFKKLLYQTKRFKPQPMVFTNIGFGSLQKTDNHLGIEIQDYRKGYFESGIIINRLFGTSFYSYGAGVAYRYGAYTFPKTGKNFAYMITLTISLD